MEIELIFIGIIISLGHLGPIGQCKAQPVMVHSNSNSFYYIISRVLHIESPRVT